VRIRDNGIGIPADEQAQLFRRFARASNVQDLHIPGTGLGPYICRELVERHGGHLWFESVEGVGTTFFLTLPLLDLGEATQEGEAAAGLPSGEAAGDGDVEVDSSHQQGLPAEARPGRQDMAPRDPWWAAAPHVTSLGDQRPALGDAS
jgi:hypothetical protein